jgi:hypothetical protein
MLLLYTCIIELEKDKTRGGNKMEKKNKFKAIGIVNGVFEFITKEKTAKGVLIHHIYLMQNGSFKLQSSINRNR